MSMGHKSRRDKHVVRLDRNFPESYLSLQMAPVNFRPAVQRASHRVSLGCPRLVVRYMHPNAVMHLHSSASSVTEAGWY